MQIARSFINQIRGGHDGGKACDRLQEVIEALAREFIQEHHEMGNRADAAAAILVESISDISKQERARRGE